MDVYYKWTFTLMGNIVGIWGEVSLLKASITILMSKIMTRHWQLRVLAVMY